MTVKNNSNSPDQVKGTNERTKKGGRADKANHKLDFNTGAIARSNGGGQNV